MSAQIFLALATALLLVWVGGRDAANFYQTHTSEVGSRAYEHSWNFSLLATILLFYGVILPATDEILLLSALTIVTISVCEWLLRKMAWRFEPRVRFQPLSIFRQ